MRCCLVGVELWAPGKFETQTKIGGEKMLETQVYNHAHTLENWVGRPIQAAASSAGMAANCACASTNTAMWIRCACIVRSPLLLTLWLTMWITTPWNRLASASDEILLCAVPGWNAREWMCIVNLVLKPQCTAAGICEVCNGVITTRTAADMQLVCTWPLRQSMLLGTSPEWSASVRMRLGSQRWCCKCNPLWLWITHSTW